MEKNYYFLNKYLNKFILKSMQVFIIPPCFIAFVSDTNSTSSSKKLTLAAVFKTIWLVGWRGFYKFNSWDYPQSPSSVSNLVWEMGNDHPCRGHSF